MYGFLRARGDGIAHMTFLVLPYYMGSPTPCSDIYLHLWRVGIVVQKLVMAEDSLHIPMHSAYRHLDVALVFPLVTVCCDAASQGRGQILYC